MKNKKRLDVLLTEQMYADTRSKAQAIIMAGLVYVNGQKADKLGANGCRATPCVADLDGDGKMEIALTTLYSGVEYFIRNKSALK